MARILFISPYYPPEKAAAAVCVSENAKRLARRGHQVTVLTTFPNYPTGIVEPAYRGCFIRQEMLDGVRVIRIWSYTSANKGFSRRILAQLSFGCLAPMLGNAKVGHPEIIIVQSPPLFDAIAVRILAYLKGCPFIFMISDLWPEAAVQFGALKNSLFIRLSEWLEWSTYLRAKRVWAVTPGLRDRLIERGLPAKHILLITNGVDTQKFRPLPQAKARAKLAWDSRFTVLYAGTHGLAHGLMSILKAAQQLQYCQDMRFIFVGDGAEKEQLVTYAHAHKLDNVTFLDPLPHEIMPELIAAADLCLIPMRDVPLLQATIPLKMLEIMACARPFLLSAKGIAREIAQQTGSADIFVEPEQPAELATAILSFYEHPQVGLTIGQKGRAYIEAHFDYEKLVDQLEHQIIDLIGATKPLEMTQYAGKA